MRSRGTRGGLVEESSAPPRPGSLCPGAASGDAPPRPARERKPRPAPAPGLGRGPWGSSALPRPPGPGRGSWRSCVVPVSPRVRRGFSPDYAQRKPEGIRAPTDETCVPACGSQRPSLSLMWSSSGSEKGSVSLGPGRRKEVG